MDCAVLIVRKSRRNVQKNIIFLEFFHFCIVPSANLLLSRISEKCYTYYTHYHYKLGQGFCFEARQKRIIIDDKYYFIDLVFYNRLLHCNVIIELKNDEFKHEDLGQLNAYVSYYKKNEMTKGDNPPVGILLYTDKGSQMVEYALSGMDNQLFVSTYMGKALMQK